MALLESNYGKLKKGDSAPAFTLKGTDGQMHSPEEFRGCKALLIVFMCNHCPYVVHKIRAITELHRQFRGKGLAIAGINSNDAGKYPDDSFENMIKFAEEHNIEFPYLVDETQAVVKAYGASCTPDPFLFGANLRLAYHGRIDDATSPGKTEATTSEMKNAIMQILESREVTVEWKPSIGCSIKWKR